MVVSGPDVGGGVCHSRVYADGTQKSKRVFKTVFGLLCWTVFDLEMGVSVL